MLIFFALTALALLLVNGVSATNVCTSASFSNASNFGIEIKTIIAVEITNYTLPNVVVAGEDQPSTTNLTRIDFCNVTIAYTHPGRGDLVHITVWLPLTSWNGRFQGIGGSGYQMSLGPDGLAPPVAHGYAAAQTDGGHDLSKEEADPTNWALDSPGNVNLNLLEDFGFTTLNELAVLGKYVVQAFYKAPAKYSYWNGCSTGGRQGLVLAQRYPDAFDGILASAPLVHWPKTATATYWAQQVMRDLNYYPRQCELEAIRAAAIETCDGLDGVRDGIISLPDLCAFDARWVVGRPLKSCNDNTTISLQAATIANSAWAGPQDINEKQLWYGLNKDANLQGVANTTCSSASVCTGNPFDIGVKWIRYFLAKDPEFSFANMTHIAYASLFHQSVQQYQLVLGASDPDLSGFRARGGKMITVHGLADEVVPPDSTIEYYGSVLQQDEAAAEFYRFFEAPGAGHCGITKGAWPHNVIAVLERWVERGKAPNTLQAHDPVRKITRPLCPFPKMQRYIGGGNAQPESFMCS